MFKIQVEAKILQKALSLIHKIPYSSGSPILSVFFIEITEGGLLISVTEESRGVQIKKAVPVSSELKIEGKSRIIVDAYLFNELIQKLEEKIEISLVEKNLIKIVSGKSKNEIRLCDDDGWVQLRKNDKKAQIELDKTEASRIANEVAFVAQGKDFELAFQGVHFLLKGGSLSLAATDGARITHKSLSLSSEDAEVLVPAKTFFEISRLLSQEEAAFEKIKISLNEGDVFFELSPALAVSVLKIKEKFPDINTQLDLVQETEIECKRSGLIKALERISVIFEKNAIPSTLLTFKEGRFLVSSPENNQIGSSREEIEVIASKGPNQTVNIKSDFLIKSLKSFSSSKIALIFSSDGGPVRLQEKNNDSLIHLIMPFWNL